MIKLLLFIAIVLLLMRAFRWPRGKDGKHRSTRLNTSRESDVDNVEDAVFKDLN